MDAGQIDELSFWRHPVLQPVMARDAGVVRAGLAPAPLMPIHCCHHEPGFAFGAAWCRSGFVGTVASGEWFAWTTCLLVAVRWAVSLVAARLVAAVVHGWRRVRL